MKKMLVLALALVAPLAVCADDVPEKRVTIYRTYGVPIDGGWRIPVRIWVAEEPDTARRLLARAVRGELEERAGLGDLTEAQKERYAEVTHDFIADSESREVVALRFEGDPTATLYRLRDADGVTRTDRNGLLQGTIVLSNDAAAALVSAQEADDGWLTVRAVSEDHGGVGRVRLIPAEGTSIVSDIDDTIKVTNIPSGEAEVLRNTFFRDFSAAPCMAGLYRSFPGDTAFHYVSGGPWQMYSPLESFLFSPGTGFPEGSFHMKSVRTNPFESESYADIWRLIADGSKQVTYDQKLLQISTLIEQFPDRDFVLVGDSGERDPEVFAAVRERFPGNVVEIRIRDVVNHAAANPERLAGMTIIPPAMAAGFDCSSLNAD